MAMDMDIGGFSDGGISSGSDSARQDWLTFLCSTAYGPPSKGPADAEVPLTRLMRAIDSKQDVAYLLRSDKRIFPNIDISHGHTPLMYAVARNNADAVRALLAHPLTYRDAVNNYGCTALDIARLLGHQDIETILTARTGSFNLLSSSTPLPPEDHQESAQPPKIVSSDYLCAVFKDACARKDVETLLRFTYAHKVVPQKDLNKLLYDAMEQSSNMPVVSILLSYRVSPNTVEFFDQEAEAVGFGLDSARDQAIVKLGEEGRAYARQAMLWAPNPYNAVDNDFTDLRRDFRKYSANRLRRECTIEIDRWGDRDDMVRSHRVAYAVVQERRRNPFTRVKLDDATLRKLFLGAVGRGDVGFMMRMIADGLKPFPEAENLGGPPDYTSQTADLYRDFQNGLLSPAPYVNVKKDKWKIG